MWWYCGTVIVSGCNKVLLYCFTEVFIYNNMVFHFKEYYGIIFKKIVKPRSFWVTLQCSVG